MNTSIPRPHCKETPTEYADRIGRWYSASISAEKQKSRGQYFTPIGVARFMAGSVKPVKRAVRILDPGAGAGILACAVCEHLVSSKIRPSEVVIEAWENDDALFPVLKRALVFVQRKLEANGVPTALKIRSNDFVLAYGHFLGNSLDLFASQISEPTFDIAISNPPYFKIAKSDPRALAAASVVHGQPNIYGLFMAIAARLLDRDGQLVTITPRSFASGPYFRMFREFFFEMMRPELLHVFESRTEAFRRDGVLQENIIMKAVKKPGWAAAGKFGQIVISSSARENDLLGPTQRKVPVGSVLDMTSRQKFLRIPITEKEDEVMKTVDSWPASLKSLGLSISTGRVVPFRALRFLSGGNLKGEFAPLLWMQNVRPMKVEWPVDVRNKPQYISSENGARALLVPRKTYVLLRRFSAKEEHRRLVAAPLFETQLDSDFIGLENHLNYIHRPNGSLSEEEACGLAVLYNTELLDTYFRAVNGNTQVSATELREIRLPDRDVIIEIGRRALAVKNAALTIEGLAALAYETLLVHEK